MLRGRPLRCSHPQRANGPFLPESAVSDVRSQAGQVDVREAMSTNGAAGKVAYDPLRSYESRDLAPKGCSSVARIAGVAWLGVNVSSSPTAA